MADDPQARSHSLRRDKQGRFRPGCSGNPRGRPVGTVGPATLLRRALSAGEALRVAETIIAKAVAGNLTCAKFVVDRLDPRPRGRPVALEFPAGADLADRLRLVFEAACAGQITPAEAARLARALEREAHGRRTARSPDPDSPVIPGKISPRDRGRT
jgi:hypothetical protein